MPFLYSAAVGAYHLGVRIAAGWNPKARAWVKGREGLWERLNAKRAALKGCLWMHCASVGEFEQGRTVLEAIKAQRPELPVLLTFFSPSGYEARKDYALATHVDYLPPDSFVNATRLVDLIAPKAAIFVKYEFWYHHLHALKTKSVPAFLVSAIFRGGQPFFQWYGGAWRQMLGCYERIFTQDEASKNLLTGIGVRNVTVSGDTRFDRVMALVGEHERGEDPASQDLHLKMTMFRESGDSAILVCGSTWPKDDDLLLTAVSALSIPVRLILAPHEYDRDHAFKMVKRMKGPSHSWSDIVPERYTPPGTTSMFIDRMGLLARVYTYGDIAYVGGGFGDGIHSLLEAAAWGKPVIFGPKHTKFAEAKGLIDAGGGFEVRNAEELRAVLDRLLGDKEALSKTSEAAGRYVRERVGATERTVGVVLASIA